MTSRSQASLERLAFSATEARRLLLVQAIEEADGEELLATQRDRDQATRAARLDRGSELDAEAAAAFLVRRARSVCERMESNGHELEPWVRGRWRIHPIWVLLPAFLVGLLSGGLGPERQVNVLANPILALILWNLVFLAARLVLGLRAGTSREPAQAPRANLLVDRLFHHVQRRLDRDSARRHAVLTRAIPTFLLSWRRSAGPLLAARIEGLLHLGAAALVGGAILGMYQRGIVRLYTATWESTFLDPATADTLLSILLFPARLAGIQVPGVASLAETPTSAAPWIHAWALSALALAVLPRLGLALFTARRVAEHEGAIEVDLRGPYFRRLLGPLRGDQARILIVPYSYQPSARRLDALRTLLHDVFGARAEVRSEAPLEYGAELAEGPFDTPAEASPPPCYVLLFSLAQSPELEVHGEFLREIQDAGTGSLLVLIDSAPYAERLAELPEAEVRLTERRRAWERVLRDTGQTGVPIDLDGPASEERIRALAEGVWRPEGPQ